jgi:hypothetical protein
MNFVKPNYFDDIPDVQLPAEMLKLAEAHS